MLRSLLVVLACAAVGAAAAPALGAGTPPVRPALPRSVSTTHFTVWYQDDPAQPGYITQTQAGDLAALAEHALTAETGWGLAAPVDDGDGHVDVYVADLSGAGVDWAAIPDGAAAPSSGSIDISHGIIGADREQHAVASALMQLIAYRFWVPPADESGDWLFYGPDEWAGFRTTGYASIGRLGPLELSLDCHDSALGLQKCDADPYVDQGSARWPFYEYLAQRYGASLMQDAWAGAASSGSALAGLQGALAARGASLADALNDYAVRELAHGWGVGPLDAADVPVTGGPISTGATTGPIPSTTVSVNHLAARIVELTRGDGNGGHECFAATLSLSVALPAGVAARPFFYWSLDRAPQAFSVDGSTATLSVPWDTCLWDKGVGYVLLPNPSTGVDGASFTLSGTLAVDPTRPATPGPDPTLPPIPGAVPVPSSDVTPTISVFGPLLLRVSSASPTLRLIVQSNAEGALHGALGSVNLGSAALRPGGNDVRFRLPKSLLASLRRSSSASTVLTLTPVSPAGTAGQAVTRRVAVTPATAKQPKKK